MIFKYLHFSIKLYKGIIKELMLGTLFGLSNSWVVAKFPLSCGVFANACFLIYKNSNPFMGSVRVFLICHLNIHYCIGGGNCCLFLNDRVGQCSKQDSNSVHQKSKAFCAHFLLYHTASSLGFVKIWTPNSLLRLSVTCSQIKK